MASYDNFDKLQIFGGSSAYEVNPDIDLSDSTSKVVTKNELSYNASPNRANDMTLTNDQEAYYVPTIEVTLNMLSASDYAKLMQIINSRGFIVYYFDQELGELVYRSMYATDQTISDLAHSIARVSNSVVARLDGQLKVTLKFISRYGYPYTKRGSAYYTEANKYHMYELHAHRSASDFLPMSHTMTEEDYV